MVICVAVDCKSDSRQGNVKQQWLTSKKCRKFQSIQLVRMCHACCLG